jgi:hypothetical protein
MLDDLTWFSQASHADGRSTPVSHYMSFAAAAVFIRGTPDRPHTRVMLRLAAVLRLHHLRVPSVLTPADASSRLA